MTFDPYGTLMINHGIVFRLCSIYTAAVRKICLRYLCCEPCSFCHVNILIQKIIQVFCVFYLYILDMTGLTLWDTVSMNLAQ